MRYQKIDAIHALIAAFLFGASTPLIKLLLNGIQPVQIASLLYLGSAVGLSLLALSCSLAKNIHICTPISKQSMSMATATRISIISIHIPQMAGTYGIHMSICTNTWFIRMSICLTYTTDTGTNVRKQTGKEANSEY